MGQASDRRGRSLQWAYLGHDWRARWRSLVVLTLLLALAAGVAAAAIAGARRSASSPSRFRDASWSRDLFVTGADEKPAALAKVLDGPLVEDHLDLVFVFAGRSAYDGDSFFFAPTSRTPSRVERGVLESGRRADPTKPEEVVLTEAAARQFGVQAGGTLTLVTLSPAQAKAIFEGVQPTSADGPRLRLRVTGIVRTGADLSARRDGPALTVLSPAFLGRYGDEVGLGASSHMVRLLAGRRGLKAFTDAATKAVGARGELGFDTTEVDRLLGDSIAVITVALVLLAVVIAGAGLAWAASASARHQRGAAADVEVLRALGATPSEQRALLTGTVMPALAAGAFLAPLVALALSPVFPVGLARRHDPAPGLHADLTVLLATPFILLAVLGPAAVLVGSRLAGQSSRQAAAGRPSPGLLERVSSWLSPAPATGVRFALSGGRTGAPVRAALAGATVGVIGLAGVGLIGTSIDRLVATPARWGTTWDVAVDTQDSDPARLADDPAIAAAAVGLFDEQVAINGREAVASTFDEVKGSLTPTVIQGREPRAGDEVAVGRKTLDGLRRAVGDTVSIRSRSSPAKEFRIVGVVLFGTIDLSAAVADGATFTAAGGDRLKLGDPDRDDAGFRRLLVRWVPGVDRVAAQRRLFGAATATAPIRPPEVAGLRDVRQFPVLAAAALVILGVIATSHALLVTVRRRRAELGVLSALGFAPRQRRVVIAVQATAVAMVALVFGLPLGAVAGRVAWSAIAGSLGVATDAVYPIALLAAGAAVVIATLNLIGAVPGRAAARLRPADALRAE